MVYCKVLEFVFCFSLILFHVMGVMLRRRNSTEKNKLLLLLNVRPKFCQHCKLSAHRRRSHICQTLNVHACLGHRKIYRMKDRCGWFYRAWICTSTELLLFLNTRTHARTHTVTHTHAHTCAVGLILF